MELITSSEKDKARQWRSVQARRVDQRCQGPYIGRPAGRDLMWRDKVYSGPKGPGARTKIYRGLTILKLICLIKRRV